MPDIVSFLPMHASQIRQIAASIDTGPELAVRVKATQRDREIALEAVHAAGVKELPKAGAFTLGQIDEVAVKAFPSTHPSYIAQRIKFKAQVHAGGLLLEELPVNKEAIVRAGLMLRKAGIPGPDGKPYSIERFDELIAGKDISISHKLEIKQACIAAGLVEPGVTAKPSVATQAISAAKMICDSLGLDYPENGKKLKVAVVDDAMDGRDWNRQRCINAKSALATAGVL